MTRRRVTEVLTADERITVLVAVVALLWAGFSFAQGAFTQAVILLVLALSEWRLAHQRVEVLTNAAEVLERGGYSGGQKLRRMAEGTDG